MVWIMNPYYPVKEEYPGSIGTSPSGDWNIVQPPQPMEGLHDSGPPPFLTKIYDMVDDQKLDHIVSWSRGGQSFVVWDPAAFSTNLLPRYFKHNNFSSFVRQLNTYGFRKIDPDVWEFANEAFLRGQKHILKNIKRRKASPHSIHQQDGLGPCVELGAFGIDGEVDRLKRDRHILLKELVKLRQDHQDTVAHLQTMEMRIQESERKQQKMMNFLAKALRNPDFIHKLAQHGKRKVLEEVIMRKRRRPIGEGPSGVKSGITLGQSGKIGKLVKAEPQEFGDPFEISELEVLALEMQGFGRPKRNDEEEEYVDDIEELEGGDQEIGEEFWEELIGERQRLDDESCADDSFEDEDVTFLSEKLDFFGSSSQ